VSRTEVFDQGLTGFVLKLLESRGCDADRQGHSCGEGCAYGLGFQVAGAFSQNAEHDLTHGGVSPPFRLHPWPAEAFLQVQPDTGNRPCGHLLLQRQVSHPRPAASREASCTASMQRCQAAHPCRHRITYLDSNGDGEACESLKH
jgi:hypothetical protein